jgi:hypothetical protein
VPVGTGIGVAEKYRQPFFDFRYVQMFQFAGKSDISLPISIEVLI